MDPDRRAKLTAWAQVERTREAAVARNESPADRVRLALELSDLAREIGIAAGAAWTRGADDLEEKARRLALPLRLSAQERR